MSIISTPNNDSQFKYLLIEAYLNHFQSEICSRDISSGVVYISSWDHDQLQYVDLYNM